MFEGLFEAEGLRVRGMGCTCKFRGGFGFGFGFTALSFREVWGQG